MLVLGVLAGVGLITVLYVISLYNTLVGLRNQMKNAWAQIEVQLKRRHDLIPNLIETVKGYMQHEQRTLENVTKARAEAMAAAGPGERSTAETKLAGALNDFRLVVENYPALKANQNFIALQEELSSTENRIAFARQSYNDQTMMFNNKIQMVPSNIIAGVFGFQAGESFELSDPQERQAPQVRFS